MALLAKDEQQLHQLWTHVPLREGIGLNKETGQIVGLQGI